jgi:hypothetical protein
MSAGGDSKTAGGNKTTKPQHTKTHTMNAIKKLLLSAGLPLLMLGGTANAARFKLETVVPGYPGYTLVRPELRSVLGGRVRWNATLRCYETDRVSRSEPLRISILPSTTGERCFTAACAGVSSANGFAVYQAVNLPYVETRFRVSPNPAFDNVILSAQTTSGRFEMRLPIGRR